MAPAEMFVDVIRSTSDLAGVFEFDGETGYFYLYQTRQEKKVLDAIHVLSGRPDFDENDIVIKWNCNQDRVGLFIKGKLWAAFDADPRAKYGGNYSAGGHPQVPPSVARDFVHHA